MARAVRGGALLGLCAVARVALAQAPAFVVPELPRATVDVASPTQTGRTLRVPISDGAALQATLDSAVGGDVILLPNFGVYVGRFVLTPHAGAGVVTLRSESVPVPGGTRVAPDASLATLATPTVSPALTTAAGATGWRVVAVRLVVLASAVDNYGIVVLGNSERTLADLPRGIVLDRVIIDGGDQNTSRCVAFNGAAMALVDSWLANCHAKGRDAQGVEGWAGPGPFLIRNTHIEGSGQAIMFGGADPSIATVTPSDITIQRNELWKPLSWGGGRWTVKAAFELKHARRVVFEGNVIENHWADAQVGFAILIQAVNQDSSAPWSTVADVTIRDNVIRNATSGLDILSRYTATGTPPDSGSRRILVTNNVFREVGTDPISGASGGRFTMLLSDHQDVTVLGNTFVGAGAAAAVLLDGAPSIRTTLRNNVFATTLYGIIGSGLGVGAASIAQYLPGATITGNVFAGQPERLYPPGQWFPDSLPLSAFVSAATGNYALPPTSPYATAGGLPVGVTSGPPVVVVRDPCALTPIAFQLDGAPIRVTTCAPVIELSASQRWTIRFPPCTPGGAWRWLATTYTSADAARTRAKRAPLCPA